MSRISARPAKKAESGSKEERKEDNRHIRARRARFVTTFRQMVERPVLVAPDKFKGTFSAPQVAGAIGRGLEKAGLMPPDLCPVADGGDGTLDALLTQLGGELIARTVQGPLGAPVKTGYALIEDGGTAIIEMAMASGLALMEE